MSGEVFWKATAPSGLDFHTSTVDYAAACGSGVPLSPDLPGVDGFPGPGWLHLATVPTEGKHRYIYLLGSRTERREARALLQWPVLPYPKAPTTEERQ